ncbi:MAG: hypothetical protein EOM50_23940, partial [Erysipelotrichia bacterium]|nr:hypothetical protein [Erysipelotrichia bacterium]
MIGKIIVLILLIVAQAHAYTIDTASSDTYVKDFGIYVYGDIESIENAFILVQAIATSSQLQTIIALFMTFFLPYVTYRHLMQGQFRAWTTNVVYATGSILFMSTSVVPSASIHIEDLRTSTIYAGLPARTYAKIDQIPYPIALVTSTISTLTDSLTLLYEDAVALIDPDLGGASATAVGAGKGLGDLLKVLQYSSFDGLNDANTSLFIRSLLAYTESCGIKGALNDDPDKLINFKNPSKDIFKSISPTALGITGSSYTLEFTDATNGTKSYQCDVFWNNNIISQYETVSDKLLEKVNKMTTSDLTSPDVITAHTKMGGEVSDAVIATDLGKYKAFQLNVATVPLVEK